MQQQVNGEGGGEPGMSTGEAETTGESFQQSRKKKSEAYRGITEKGSMQPTGERGGRRGARDKQQGNREYGGELRAKEETEG